jgi:hypothetical protein
MTAGPKEAVDEFQSQIDPSRQATAVMMSPPSMISFSVSTRILGNRSASVCENVQCVVADRPF